MGTGGIGCLGSHPVVRQQPAVVGRELLGVSVGVDRQCHAVGTVPRGHAVQGPQGVLQSLAEAGKALREADGDMLPVGRGQDEMVQQMIEQLSGDRYA